MVDERRLLDVLTEFAHALVEDYDVLVTLEELSQALVEVTGVSSAGVCLANGEDLLDIVASCGTEVLEVAAFERDAQQGPCYDAYDTMRPAIVTDLRGPDLPWPELAAQMAAAGVGGVAGHPDARRRRARRRHHGLLARGPARTRPGVPRRGRGLRQRRDRVRREQPAAGRVGRARAAAPACPVAPGRRRAGQGHPRRAPRLLDRRCAGDPPALQPRSEPAPQGGRAPRSSPARWCPTRTAPNVAGGRGGPWLSWPEGWPRGGRSGMA